MRLPAAIAMILALSGPAQAQEAWGDLDGLMKRSLSISTPVEIAFWLPDRPDPAHAREALGIAYPIILGAAGNTTIVTGYYVRGTDGFTLAGTITDLFGHDPREIRFLPDRIEVTTTMPNPGDPRCCPTGQTRWSIPKATLVAAPAQ